MKNRKAAKKRPSFWQTLKAASGPYRRLYGYVKPYKARFILGLSLGVAFGMVNSLLPLVVARVTSTIFHGAAPNPMALRSNLEMLNAGPKINSIILICLAIPAIMTVRSLCSYGNSYYMNWVSNKVVTDIRGQLFGKIVRHSMDFFNKMRSGFLMSRITNDTRAMQMALTSVSSDLFKQPVAVVGAITVLLVMDWKFTVVTLILFPACLLPIRIYGRRARKAVQSQYEGMGEMLVTMQETFAGIRIVKSFAREAHQEKSFKRSNQSPILFATFTHAESLQHFGCVLELDRLTLLLDGQRRQVRHGDQAARVAGAKEACGVILVLRVGREAAQRDRAAGVRQPAGAVPSDGPVHAESRSQHRNDPGASERPKHGEVRPSAEIQDRIGRRQSQCIDVRAARPVEVHRLGSTDRDVER